MTDLPTLESNYPHLRIDLVSQWGFGLHRTSSSEVFCQRAVSWQIETDNAAESGDLKILRALIEASHPGIDLTLSLCFAAHAGHVECVRELIPRADLELNNFAPLRAAAASGHLACLELLIPASYPRAGNSLALFEAAQRGHLKCVNALLPRSILKKKHRGRWECLLKSASKDVQACGYLIHMHFAASLKAQRRKVRRATSKKRDTTDFGCEMRMLDSDTEVA